MKNLFILSALVLLLFSCKKETKDVIIIRNCTGTYLQVDGKQYRVCNHNKIQKFSAGITLKMKFKHIDNCDSDEFVCQMDYPHDGDVIVTNIP